MTSDAINWNLTCKDLYSLPNGTLIFMDWYGWHLCEVSGNLAGDTQWKIQRMSDCQSLYGSKLTKARFALV